MKGLNFLLAFLFLVLLSNAQVTRAPSYPLITHDTYFSIWSASDELNTSVTQHWTGANQSLTGYLLLNDTAYRFLGNQAKSYQSLAATADEQGYNVKYDTSSSEGWNKETFNDNHWKTGAAPFGNEGPVATAWTGRHIFIRRSFNLDQLPGKPLFLKLRHDDNVEVYLNGKQVYATEGWVHKYSYIRLDNAEGLLHKGSNLLAIHCANTAGGQFIDAGLVTEAPVVERTSTVQALQTSVAIHATRTIYTFKCGAVDLKVTFTSPLLMNDLALIARPVSYISFETTTASPTAKKAKIIFSASSDIAVNEPSQDVQATSYKNGGLKILKAGTIEQPILQKKGDDLRIDWGYMYVAAPANASQFLSAGNADIFAKNPTQPATLKGRSLLLNTVLTFDNIRAKPAEQTVLIGYDDLQSVQYFGTNLRPYWKQQEKRTIEQELQSASKNRQSILKKAAAFDDKLYADAMASGGKEYADLCALAYRQAISAHKLVISPQGELLFLSKENFSNGSINTVDITYPSAPQFLLYNPELLKGMMNGIFYYSESGKWTKPFAAHDLGTYPLANGQTYAATPR